MTLRIALVLNLIFDICSKNKLALAVTWLPVLGLLISSDKLDYLLVQGLAHFQLCLLTVMVQ